MRTLTPGQWYLLFTCASCRSKQMLFPDLSDGKSKIRATYNVACTQCGHRASYDTEIIERYQHPADTKSPANHLATDQLL